MGALAALVVAVTAVAALAAVPSLRPPGAHADGDPAGDVVLGEGVFYPYSQPVTAATQWALNTAAARAAAARFPLKGRRVALLIALAAAATLVSATLLVLRHRAGRRV